MSSGGKVLSRPVVRTQVGQTSQIVIGQKQVVVPANGVTNSTFPIETNHALIDLRLTLTGDVTPDAEHFLLNVKGESRGQVSEVQSKLPVGQTLLVDLGAHVVEGRSEQGVPVLDKVPRINRLFKNVGIGRETYRRLVFLTPRFETE
ncbi:MAG: hypothetical protein KDA84_01835 [Planctomycetaceae bacterium]|nr:hypothetical protein [Planctomycetaceae bacterium]